MRLIPTDTAFFSMLTELAVRVTSASTLLDDLMEHPDQRDPLVRLIREDEHAADELTHQIVLRLGTSFVPPLDASEIYELAHALEATIDVIEDAAARMEMFDMKEVDAPVRTLTAIARRCAEAVEKAVAKLDDANSILDGISDVWRLEEEGDAIYESAIRNLFTESIDAMDVLKRKEMYEMLETAIDRSRVTAAILTSIAVKRT